MRTIRVTDIIAIVGGAVAGALVCTWTAGVTMPGSVRAIFVFFSMKVTGDALQAVLARGETHYLEDILGDLAAYAGLAVVSSAAIWVARRYLGGYVEPVFPGTVAHAVLTLMPGREEQRRAARG